jgi:hypothetical protein
MRTEELIKIISEESKDNDRFVELKSGMPIGQDARGSLVLAQKRVKPMTVRHTCVTGVGKTNFIRRMLITLSCLYDRDEASFFVLSNNDSYGELIRLSSGDFTVPYIRGKEDLTQAVATLKELLRMREYGKGYPHLFVVLDGLDELSDCNKNGDLEEYRDIFDLFMRKEDVDFICGADLGKSIFAGFPGAFLGVGNCLVTTYEAGKADVTYVNDDSSLTLPMPIVCPSEPTVLESISYLNALPMDVE